MTRGWSTALAQVWAAGGVIFLFIEAVWRLAERGVATMRAGLTPFEWVALALLVAAFVYGEGIRALQRRWVPHVFSRIEALRTEPGLLNRVLAPIYAMSLMGASRVVLMRAWLGVALIVAAVLIVSRFPEPWRGIVDLAVASALAWATLVLVSGTIRLLRGMTRER